MVDVGSIDGWLGFLIGTVTSLRWFLQRVPFDDGGEGNDGHGHDEDILVSALVLGFYWTPPTGVSHWTQQDCGTSLYTGKDINGVS